MSEAENITPIKQSFAERVYLTFRAINIEPHIAQKGKLDYLPWAPAWNFVLQTFPESEFEFDEPRMFPGTGGEQWVTVRIKEGDNCLERRWWLPYLDFKNAPVENPTSLQINNTRMRVLVKCLAMCGLGTELYAGEDVPDKDHDAQVHGAARGSVLPPDQIFEGRGHIDTINESLPLSAIQTDSAGRIVGYDKDQINYASLDEMLSQFDGKQELKLWVFDAIDKLQNRALRKYEKQRSDNEPKPEI